MSASSETSHLSREALFFGWALVLSSTTLIPLTCMHTLTRPGKLLIYHERQKRWPSC